MTPQISAIPFAVALQPHPLSAQEILYHCSRPLLSRNVGQWAEVNCFLRHCFQAVISPCEKDMPRSNFLMKSPCNKTFLKHSVDVCFPCCHPEIHSTIWIFHWTVDTIRTCLQGTENYFPLISMPKLSQRSLKPTEGNRNKAVEGELPEQLIVLIAPLHQFFCIDIFKCFIKQYYTLCNLFVTNTLCRHHSGVHVNSLYAAVPHFKTDRWARRLDASFRGEAVIGKWI